MIQAFPFQGKRNRYKIGRHPEITPVQARDVAHLLAAKVAQGIDPQEEKKQARIERERESVRTLRGFLKKQYEPWVLSERKRGHETLARIRYQFADLLDRPIKDINAWIIEKWRSEQLKRGKKPNTVNRDIAALKAALSKAVEWDLVKVNPIAHVKLARIDNRAKVRYLSRDEEERLRETLLARETRIRTERISANTWRRERGYLEYPDLKGCAFADHLRTMVLLAMNTGMRRGELCFTSPGKTLTFISAPSQWTARKRKAAIPATFPSIKRPRRCFKTGRRKPPIENLSFPPKMEGPLTTSGNPGRPYFSQQGLKTFVSTIYATISPQGW